MTFELYHRERALPIVAMYYLGVKINGFHKLQHSYREKRKSFGVVVFAVQALTLEIIFVVDKIPYYSVEFKRKDTAVLSSPREFYVYAFFKPHFLAPFLLYLSVKRYNGAHVGFRVLSFYRLRQSAHDVSQAARSRKRKRLASDIKNRSHQHHSRSKPCRKRVLSVKKYCCRQIILPLSTYMGIVPWPESATPSLMTTFLSVTTY